MNRLPIDGITIENESQYREWLRGGGVETRVLLKGKSLRNMLRLRADPFVCRDPEHKALCYRRSSIPFLTVSRMS